MEITILHGLPLGANVGIFIMAAVVIWFSGTNLAYCGDQLAERYGLSRAFIGLIFLATATSLPEIVTTIVAASAGNAQLALGNLFGGITMQTAILAVVDIFVVRYALTSWPRKPTHALEAVMLVILLSALLALLAVGEIEVAFGVGLGALGLAVSYPVVIALLRQIDESSSWAPVDLPNDPHLLIPSTGQKPLAELSNKALLLRAGLSVLGILFAGIVLVDQADVISVKSGLGASFVGLTLLAAATSLPELSTTLAAARMGSYTMAISNIFGSNLIMVTLILPADIMYRQGPILQEANGLAQFSIAVGIVVTAIYVAGILIRKTPRAFGVGVDSLLVLAIYIGSLFALYNM